VIWAEPKVDKPNVFKDDKEEDLPDFGGKANEESKEQGIELKNYIKEMNKFLDEPASKKD
jgi:hypothetical protein